MADRDLCGQPGTVQNHRLCKGLEKNLAKHNHNMKRLNVHLNIRELIFDKLIGNAIKQIINRSFYSYKYVYKFNVTTIIAIKHPSTKLSDFNPFAEFVGEGVELPNGTLVVNSGALV